MTARSATARGNRESAQRCAACGSHEARSTRPEPLDLVNRLSLRPPEAAAVLGVSERTLRVLLPELPHVRRGGVVLVPVDALREWLGREAKAQRESAQATAGEILEALGRTKERRA